jgi:hypothetical protein
MQTRVPERPDPLASLSGDARKGLDELALAIERVPLQDLPLYADRRFDDEHVRAVEAAERVAHEAGLTNGIRAAQRALREAVVGLYGSAQMRGTILGTNIAPPPGTDEDRIRMLESLGDAVSATVLGDRLDPDDHAELLGLWARLLP